MKTAFLVLGAQRSGTSVTSHMLSEFQVNFGSTSNFLQAEHNPTFFELKWVNQYNDRLIKSLGYKYTDFFLPIEADYDRADILNIAQELPALIRHEWNDELKIGIKDPRFSLTFPIWQRTLLAEGYTLKVIFVFRCPSSFLRSNQKLLNNWAGWDNARHLHFWLQLNLTAIYFARNFSICFISYDNMMNQPLDVSQQLADFFQFEQQHVDAAADAVDGIYHHHRKITKTGYPAIDRYYRLLCSHSLSATDYLDYRNRVLTEMQTESTFYKLDGSLEFEI